MSILKRYFDLLSISLKKKIIVFCSLLGDLICSILVYNEVTNFSKFQLKFKEYAESKIFENAFNIIGVQNENGHSITEILMAQEFQVQIFRLLIQSTFTMIGLILVFHLVIYFLFYKNHQNKGPKIYLQVLTFSGFILTSWYALSHLIHGPIYSLFLVLGLGYFILFSLLRNLEPQT